MKKAFTLTETLITIVILGIVAAILVPNLIKNQVENANRTKVKKAMAAYEKTINMMIIENDIKSTEALRELGQDNCQYTREYFKTVQDGTNNCIFKAADRVWWDIMDITNPIISLKDEITDSNKVAIRANALSLNADKTSFALIGRFDEIGTLRVNDNAYEQGLENNLTNQAYMIKLWHFVNNNYDFSAKEQFATCKANGADTCTISRNGEQINYTKIITDIDVNTSVNYSIVTAPAGEYWISENFLVTRDEAKAITNSTCTTAACISLGDYYEASKLKCQRLGGHLANISELKIAYDNGMLTGDDNYTFSSEEYGSSTDSTYCRKGSNGSIGYGCHKGNTRNRGICIIND